VGRAELLLYAAVFSAIVAAFVHTYEEPVLSRRYREQYEAYRRAVPAWLPRWSPWKPGV
jgi:protein-S-isoprenylcysteine O-methyltransferase Ste14